MFGINSNLSNDTASRPNSVLKSKRNHDSGLYYNDSYAAETFINVFTDNAEADTFGVLNDPTYTGFKLFFHFDATSGLFADERYENSALAYLKRIGQTDRYNLLQRFINVISRVNSETPWIFQSIDGLEEMYNTPFQDIYINKQLVIQTLETIDGKISSIAQMYRNIAYDFERRVEVLPVNLRRFGMSIYLYDFRNFDNLSQTAVDLLQTVRQQDVKQLNHILLDVGYCQFDITSGTGPLTAANNMQHDMTTNNLKINYEKYVISSLFKSITGNTQLSSKSFVFTEAALLGETEFRPNRTIAGQTININKYEHDLLDSDAWKRKATDAFGDVKHAVFDRIHAELTGALLGNVHGFSFADLMKFSTDTDYRVQFSNAYSRISGNTSLSNVTSVTADDMGTI